MTSTQDINTYIDEAIAIEEEAIVIYGRHLKTVSQWMGFSEMDMLKINDYITVLQEDSKKHSRMLERVKELLGSN